MLTPAFPYPHFTQVTREDSDALFAFLRERARALDNLVKLAIAEISAKAQESKADAEQARTELGFAQAHHDRTHEAIQGHQDRAHEAVQTQPR